MLNTSSKENSSVNVHSQAEILHNFERHKEIIREHQARQKRQAMRLKQSAEEDSKSREQALRTLKEEKRELYQRFLKINRSSSASKKETEVKQTLEHRSSAKKLPPPKYSRRPEQEPPSPKSKTAGFSSNMPRFVQSESRNEFDPLRESLSDENDWRNFESVEQQVLGPSTLPTKKLEDIEAELDRMISDHITTPQNKKVSTISEIPTQFLTESKHLSPPKIQHTPKPFQYEDSVDKDILSGSRRSILHQHISNGRKIDLSSKNHSYEELERQERELLESIRQLDERSKQLSNFKEYHDTNEYPALKSDQKSNYQEDRKAILDSLDILEEETNKERLRTTDASSIQMQRNSDQHSYFQKPLSQLSDTQSYSIIAELSSFPKLEPIKGSYSKRNSRRKDILTPVPPPIISEDPELKVDGDNKFVYNPQLLKELLNDRV